ncbi:MAG: SpoIIE family protein phosphatase, partial [Desulfovibrionaceae bacterium]|nr:SpoIIE family protein phosphatase [Desulfovibrionaceae bacterium]
RLFLYTDGVTETTDDQQLYGEKRLQGFLNDHAACNAAETLQTLQGELQKFAGNTPQFDDITMLLLDFKGVSMRSNVF